MTLYDFFRGFIAALRKEGIRSIETRVDRHHARFAAVARMVRDESSGVFAGLPALAPNPFTGRFRDFDEALLKLQQGFLAAPNPYYPVVRIKITEGRADRVLARYDPKTRDAFARLAVAWSAHEPESVEQPSLS